MKILLINPPYTTIFGWGLSYSEPLGLAYIAAAIEKSHRHDVEIIDCVGMEQIFPDAYKNPRVGMEKDSVLELLKKKEFDVIGISLIKMATDEKQLYDFIAALRKTFPGKPIIGGGPDATLDSQAYMETGNVDYIVIGEGEGTIVELLDALSGDRNDVKDIPGIVYRDNDGNIVRTGPREPLDINTIPWPARHLLPMENYLRYRVKAYYRRSPAATILTSRACPYKCVFCSVKIIWGNKWRGRSPVDVVDEMQHLVDHYGVREILIQDDNFMADPKRVDAICDEILRRKLSITWQVVPGLAIWLLTKDLLKKLRDSGLYALCAQIETGNMKTLNYINKKISFEHARDIMHYANELGLWTQTNIIIGFYFETREDIEETIRMAESFHVDNVSYIFARPYPHTEMYDDYLEKGIISQNHQYTEPLDTLHMTRDELISLRKRAQRGHYLKRIYQISNPVSFYKEFWPKINSIEKAGLLMRRIVYG
jgi:anaerobic magnesium-protoporphyrin IX monomethyl ester cyclase